MKHIMLTIAVLCMFMASCKKEETKTSTTTVEVDTASATTETAPAAPMDSVAMMKAWEAYATPGETHKMLATDVGTWDEECTMYNSANDPKPSKWKMTATTKMIMGGRYQESRHSGMVMGAPFEGVSTMGYDNASKKLVSTWYDNMGTGIMNLSGDFDQGSKTIELTGQITDPMTGKQKPYRETFHFVDENTRHMVMYDVTPEGTEYKSMEITMKRKK